MNILVCGAGGFIGHNLVKRLVAYGHTVTGVDLKYPEFSASPAHRFIKADLRDASYTAALLDNSWDEIYQLAADMGGAGYVFTGKHDAEILRNNCTINLNVADGIISAGITPKVFYASSACVYPQENQCNPDSPKCAEATAYPANPDSDYGFEKLFSERLYQAYHRNYDLDIRIARFHNIYGPDGTWCGGREKAPAAMCRKVIYSLREPKEHTVEIWGDGEQTRSFLYIVDCLDAVSLLMQSTLVQRNVCPSIS